MRSRRMVACIALSLMVLAACQHPASGDRPAEATRTQGTTTTAPPVEPVTKLLVFVVENHSLNQMRHQMPAMFGLAEKYGYATRYRAVTHPSLPNYLAIAGGSTFGVSDDASPASHVIHGRSVFGQAIHAGKTATVYAEGMPGRCALQSGGGRYAVKHNPWAYFVDERASCNRHDLPLRRYAADAASGNLPNAGMVVPNLCHDAHDADCDLSDADAWLDRQVGKALDGPDFASGHLAVVITADEDDRTQGNRVLTIVLHPSQDGHVVRTRLTHYSLTRLYDGVLGVSPLRKAARARDLATAFGLPLTGD